MIMVRVTPEPSCTTVCTGITTEGGITTAIIASRINPPAVPVKTPMKAVAKEASVSPANISGPISGVPRKCISWPFPAFVWISLDRVSRARCKGMG